MCVGFVKATVHLTTDDDSLPGGPYFVTLTCDESKEHPWVLTGVELASRPTAEHIDLAAADTEPDWFSSDWRQRQMAFLRPPDSVSGAGWRAS